MQYKNDEQFRGGRMSIIIAIKAAENVIIGSDTQTTIGEIVSNDSSKLHLINFPVEKTDSTEEHQEQFLLGVSGNFYLKDLIRSFKPPFKDDTDSFLDYMYQHFIPEFQSYLDDYRFMEYRNGGNDISSTCLIIYKTQVYRLNYNLTLEEVESEYCAIGSGSEIAYGSLHTSKNNDDIESLMLEKALCACAEHNIYCNDTFTVYVSNKDGTFIEGCI